MTRIGQSREKANRSFVCHEIWKSRNVFRRFIIRFLVFLVFGKSVKVIEGIIYLKLCVADILSDIVIEGPSSWPASLYSADRGEYLVRYIFAPKEV